MSIMPIRRAAYTTLLFTFILIVCAPTARAIKSGKQRPPEPTAVGDRLTAIEKSVQRIMMLLSGQAEALDVPKVTSAATSPELPVTDAATVLEKRLEATEKSLANVAAALAAKNEKPGSNCRWVRECVYITCCKWGAPPSDPGTVKCTEQCCGTWENRLVCD
jgi:hypothetical protein